MKTLRTEVAIVGAGPAGLMLARLLALEGIASVVIESRSREYVERRVRAGVLEQGSVDLLNEAGVGARMRKEGLVHHGIELRFEGAGHRIDLKQLSGGRAITVYGQQEVVKDLIAARLEAELPILFEVQDTRVLELESAESRVCFTHAGEAIELRCRVVAGCDGFHGVCRPAIADALRVYDREYPFAWLGILARAKPASEELIYACHEQGFALLSMRSPEITRLYLQVAPDEPLENWPDERIWRELQVRLSTADGFVLNQGPMLEKSITGMRSFVVEPMQHGRLLLAGDAAHIVPPTGAKGMNLALADVRVMARALWAYFKRSDEAPLRAYSQTCLARVWRAEHFSYWMTSMLHRSPHDDAFAHKLQLAQLRYVTRSHAAATTLAENYVGLPFDAAAVNAD